MYYKNPFEQLDKIMKARYVFLKKAKVTEAKTYLEFLEEYKNDCYNAIVDKQRPQEQKNEYQDAYFNVETRLYAMQHETTIPRYFIEEKGLIDFLTTMPVKSLKYLKEKWGDIAYFVYTPKETYYCQCDTYRAEFTIERFFTIITSGHKAMVYPMDELDNPTLWIKQCKEHQKKLNDLTKEEKIEGIKIASDEFRLCVNALFYTIAFPEAVKEGCPSNIAVAQKKEFRDSKTKVMTLSVDARVLTKEHNGVTPHFRSGYFRHYTSDRYVNCKGEIRFIEATFVKGKSFIVEDIIK